MGSSDGANTPMMLMGSAMILLMTPGQAFFYGGFSRPGNRLNVMMMSFFLMGLLGVLWVVIGYSLSSNTGFGSPCIDVSFKATIQLDDSHDTFMRHCVAGTVGALLRRMLASMALVPGDSFPLSATILEESGHFGLFIAQLQAVTLTYGFVALGTAIILSILGALMPLRFSAEEEERGLDFVAHGEEAYDPMTN